MQETINPDAVKAAYNTLVRLYSQQAAIEDEIAGQKETLKLEGVKPADVCKLAKAAVKGNKDAVIAGANDLIELNDILS